MKSGSMWGSLEGIRALLLCFNPTVCSCCPSSPPADVTQCTRWLPTAGVCWIRTFFLCSSEPHKLLKPHFSWCASSLCRLMGRSPLQFLFSSSVFFHVLCSLALVHCHSWIEGFYRVLGLLCQCLFEFPPTRKWSLWISCFVGGVCARCN